ncbi:P-loop NTPase fold protein [Brevundimonas sp.]|uniref:P-loop NTPase fold protein n=1 Tax=Brevundimonas sp. TaxID=1871086 RepID=UPI003566A080
MDNDAPDGSVDAFLLYNEREGLIDQIADALRSAGRSVHFWRTDVAIGESWMPFEQKRLAAARVVVIFLGSEGWGPTHEAMALEAVRQDKKIVPVLIGPALPLEIMERAGRIFVERRYLQLYPESWRTDFPELLRLIPLIPLRHPLIGILLNGDDGARRRAVSDLLASGTEPSPGLLAELVEQIQLLQSGTHPETPTDERIASARSWLLSTLVELTGGSPAVERFAAHHVDYVREPYAPARFWLLEALERRAPDLGRRVAIRAFEDPVEEVRLAAQLLFTDQPQTVRPRLERALRSDEPEAAIQFFKIRPDPSLAVVVAERLASEGLAPLVIDALTFNLPISIASEALRIAQSPSNCVNRIVRVAAQADQAFLERCAELLFGIISSDPDASIVLSELAASDPQLVPTLADLDRLMRPPSNDLDGAVRIAGYDSDTLDGSPDYLDIRRDVEAVTAVMLARELRPPLAVGLFGDWGMGKSFFMRAMRIATGELRTRYPERFCQEVVQIEFNAWHYADGNLWASLVSHILQSLSDHVSPQATAESQAASLISELESARAETAALESERLNAVEAVRSREEQLQALQFERETAEVKLTQLKLQSVREIFNDPQLKAAIDQALEDLGAPSALTQIEDLQAVVRQANSLGGRAIGLARALTNPGVWPWSIAFLAALVLVPPLIAWGVGFVRAELASVVGFATAALTLAAGGAPLLLKALKVVSGHLKRLENAKAAIDRAIEERRATPTKKELDLQAALARLRGQEEAVAVRLRVAEERVAGLETRIEALKDGRSLKRFLAERTGSDDYRKHLGVMATIRKDFEDLVERLQSPPIEGHRRVDRIVLYIDDLDRCEAKKVVDVLEAVHLLLAFPLFVVVVGVDPRWLSHALASEHRALASVPERLDAKDTAAELVGRRATPQDFLEKIFQIPLALRPMSEAGFGRLMGSLLEATPDLSTDALPPIIGEAQIGLVPMTASASAGTDPDPGGADAPNRVAPSGTSVPEPIEGLTMEALRITAGEANFSSTLHAFLRTPRAAKRFSNTYRLLKAQISDGDRQRLEGDAVGAAGEFRIPMALLALVISQTAEAAAILKAVRSMLGSTAVSSGWREQISGDGASGSLGRIFVESLDASPGDPVSKIAFWLPRVARYSFEGLR